jgi:hypothetical protein
MSDAPEKIWAWIDYDGNWDGTWFANSETLQPERLPDASYIRADIHEAALAELEEERLASDGALMKLAEAEARIARLRAQLEDKIYE